MVRRKPKVFYWFQVWFDSRPPIMSPGLRFCLLQFHSQTDSPDGFKVATVIAYHKLTWPLISEKKQVSFPVLPAKVSSCLIGSVQALWPNGQGTTTCESGWPVSGEWYHNWTHGLVRGWSSSMKAGYSCQRTGKWMVGGKSNRYILYTPSPRCPKKNIEIRKERHQLKWLSNRCSVFSSIICQKKRPLVCQTSHLAFPSSLTPSKPQNNARPLKYTLNPLDLGLYSFCSLCPQCVSSLRSVCLSPSFHSDLPSNVNLTRKAFFNHLFTISTLMFLKATITI